MGRSGGKVAHPCNAAAGGRRWCAIKATYFNRYQMKPAPLPDNESQRIERLRQFGVLDTLPQEAFDHITALASAVCGTPIALISLVDQDRQWFKARVGLDVQQTPRELAFCAHAIHSPRELMEVEDASRDERFRDNPLVTEAPDIRFYAGAPIVTDDGLALGTVCVIDRRSRQLNDFQRQTLRSLSGLVVALLEGERLRQVEARRQSAEARLRDQIQQAVLTLGTDLKSFVDTQYVYRFVNRCYLTYWGKAASDIVGCHVADLVGHSTFETVIKPQLDRVLAGEEVHFDTTMDFPRLGPRLVHVNYVPARDDTGAVFGVVVKVSDVEDIHARERKLRATVELLEHKTLEQQRFIHIISHDLREPINTITNFAGLLAEHPALAGSEQARRYLGFVQNGSERMKTLLEDLLGFLHMDQHALTLSQLDTARVVSHVLDDLSDTIKRTGAQVRVGTLPPLHGDATLLRVLIQNLVSNALKFCPANQPPDVCIDGEIRAGQAVLSVTDRGIGIASGQTDKIFELFTRLNNARQFAGSGLGLSICRRIADLHLGQLTVESTVGEGSRFELVLPAQSSSI